MASSKIKTQCSFTSRYWNFDLNKETDFECKNEKHPQYDKCIFHALNFLNNKNNREIVDREFQIKINDYLSKKNNDSFDCIGYHLYNVSIVNKEFPNPVYFDEANISGSLTINSKFLNHVSFIRAQFLKGNVSFNDTKFLKGNVSFNDTKFLGGNVSFGFTQFLGGDVSFNDAQFLGDNVSFRGTQFLGGGNVSFRGTQFSKGNVSFMHTKFTKGYVSFWKAQFSGGNVDFIFVKFLKGNVSFKDAQFSGGGYVSFNASRFSCKGKVDFGDAEFSCKGDVDFNSGKFSGITSFNCKFKTNVFFRSVNFMSPNEVRFETEDLSKVSFLNTDITRIVFDANARFGKLEEKEEFKELKEVGFKMLFQRRFLSKILSERFKIFDERRFEECIDKDETITKSNLEKQKLSLGSILASYRNLRENYEYRLRYDEAGQFFIREMEIKRKYREEFSTSEERDIPKENNWFRRNFSFIGLYHNICSYGESSTFPLMYFGIILALSTFYWYTSYSLGIMGQINIKENCIEHPVLCSLERTLNDIVGFPEKGIIIDYITRISSIIVLATLFLPFRRKFERRFRH